MNELSLSVCVFFFAWDPNVDELVYRDVTFLLLKVLKFPIDFY